MPKCRHFDAETQAFKSQNASILTLNAGILGTKCRYFDIKCRYFENKCRYFDAKMYLFCHQNTIILTPKLKDLEAEMQHSLFICSDSVSDLSITIQIQIQIITTNEESCYLKSGILVWLDLFVQVFYTLLKAVFFLL
jgi:hypothetical protein